LLCWVRSLSHREGILPKLVPRGPSPHMVFSMLFRRDYRSECRVRFLALSLREVVERQARGQEPSWRTRGTSRRVQPLRHRQLDGMNETRTSQSLSRINRRASCVVESVLVVVLRMTVTVMNLGRLEPMTPLITTPLCGESSTQLSTASGLASHYLASGTTSKAISSHDMRFFVDSLSMFRFHFKIYTIIRS
jgi:hypothetical protein